MKRALLFVSVCLAGIAAVLVVAWLSGGFERVGLDANIVVALLLGIGFSSLLGVGLMALIFYSDRSGQDAEAHRVSLDPDPDELEDSKNSVPPADDRG